MLLFIALSLLLTFHEVDKKIAVWVSEEGNNDKILVGFGWILNMRISPNTYLNSSYTNCNEYQIG